MTESASDADVPVGPLGTPRSAHIRELILEVHDRRLSGEALADADVIAAHPDLMPELEAELQDLALLRAARQAAQGVEPATLDRDPPQVLTVSALNRPLDDDSDEEPLPVIPGYRIVRRISQGGQAAVYEAVQESTTRPVAVKVMWGGALAQPNAVARLDREVHILAALDHPNIVQVIHRGRTPDGSHYFVMDYVDGPTLDQHLRTLFRDHPGPLAQVLGLFVKVAKAVEAVHRRGVVHRDLKPSNIRVNAEGEPRVLDFGLASLPPGHGGRNLGETVTATGQVLGSLPWSSPEQAEGDHDRIDARTDVYALGVMLYQALTGTFPYDVHGPARRVIESIVSARPTPPSRAASKAALSSDSTATSASGTGLHIEPELDEIVLTALAKSPDARFPSAGVLGARLEAYLEGLNRPSPPPQPTAAGRRRALAFGGLAAAAIIAASLWSGWPFDPFHSGAAHQADPAAVLPLLRPDASLKLPIDSAGPPPGCVMSEPIGGAGGQPFTETVAAPGRLVGLRCTFVQWDQHEVINSVQAIYQTPNGIGYGERHGPPAGRVEQVIAREGYRIGKIEVSGGLRVDGFRMTFVPSDAKAPHTNAAYESDWHGGTAQKPSVVIRADSADVAGVFGRVGQQLDALGLVLRPR
jgi:serine/threonine protein kinase